MSPKYIALLCAGVVLALGMFTIGWLLTAYGNSRESLGVEKANLANLEKAVEEDREAIKIIAGNFQEYERILKGIDPISSNDADFPVMYDTTVKRLPDPLNPKKGK